MGLMGWWRTITGASVFVYVYEVRRKGQRNDSDHFKDVRDLHLWTRRATSPVALDVGLGAVTSELGAEDRRQRGAAREVTLDTKEGVSVEETHPDRKGLGSAAVSLDRDIEK